MLRRVEVEDKDEERQVKCCGFGAVAACQGHPCPGQQLAVKPGGGGSHGRSKPHYVILWMLIVIASARHNFQARALKRKMALNNFYQRAQTLGGTFNHNVCI